MKFFLCGSCRRHVKASERACPFCGASSFDVTGQLHFQGIRDRSVLLFGVAIAGAIAASGCTKETTSPTADEPNAKHGAVDAGLDANGPTMPEAKVTVYGAPPVDPLDKPIGPVPLDAGSSVPKPSSH